MEAVRAVRQPQCHINRLVERKVMVFIYDVKIKKAAVCGDGGDPGVSFQRACFSAAVRGRRRKGVYRSLRTGF